jgi:60 kDa SS-A/Ro ribonucleoprotein
LIPFFAAITRVAISPRMRLDSVIEKVRAIPMGGTDCALPMVWARRNKLALSGFITYTDSETWAGNRVLVTLTLLKLILQPAS